ncbi:MAG TPA: neutral zinc metallopeptidase [Rhizomicrobium sp.]|nr:neutral zinc metallopeptidase [Rhizomicrobium sp.]
MRLDNLRETTNVDDRRGQFGGGGFGGGGFGGFGGTGVPIRAGGMGIVGFIILAVLFGSNGGGGLLTGTDDSGGQTSQYSSGPHSDDAEFDFAKKIIGSTEDVWTPILAAKGIAYQPAIFTPYDSSTSTGCGEGSAAAGPFYCPEDHRVYIDLSFFNELKDRFGAPGQFAQAYVIAHEVGHNVQNNLGTMEREQAQLQGAGAKGPTGASVRLELQADCYAGVWAYNADKKFHILESGDVEGGLRAASAVGDDTLEKQSQGYVVPDSFTHGTSDQRMRWFKRGLSRGNMDDCDTFGAATL